MSEERLKDSFCLLDEETHHRMKRRPKGRERIGCSLRPDVRIKVP